MKLNALHVIDAFVRLGGTGEAAQGLGVSQSAVIKALVACSAISVMG